MPIDVEAAWVPDEFDSHWHVLGHDAFMQACNSSDPAAAATFTHDGILNEFQPDIFLISGVVSVPVGIDTATGATVGAVMADPPVAVSRPCRAEHPHPLDPRRLHPPGIHPGD